MDRFATAGGTPAALLAVPAAPTVPVVPVAPVAPLPVVPAAPVVGGRALADAGGVAGDVGTPGVDVLGTIEAPDSVNGSDALAPGVTQPLKVIVWLAELAPVEGVCAEDDDAGVCAATNADAAKAMAAAPMI